MKTTCLVMAVAWWCLLGAGVRAADESAPGTAPMGGAAGAVRSSGTSSAGETMRAARGGEEAEAPFGAPGQPEMIVFMRHGEKPASDEGQLSIQGLNRALALPGVLVKKFGKPDALFAPGTQTQVERNGMTYSYIRALMTIEPTAVSLGLPVHAQMGFDDEKGLKAALLSNRYAHASIFVAWEHHRLVEEVRDIVATLGGDAKQVPEWSGSDFDSLYILKITGAGDKRTVAFTVDHEGLNGLPATYPAK